jgi:hypothetical protein
MPQAGGAAGGDEDANSPWRIASRAQGSQVAEVKNEALVPDVPPAPQSRPASNSRLFSGQRAGLVVLFGVLAVPVSSALGLLHPMMELGGEVFLEVWSANLWGSLLFTIGTFGSFLLVVVFVFALWQNLQPGMQWLGVIAAIPVALFSSWAVYALSWGLTGVSYDDSMYGFLVFSPDWGESWGFVWEWGLVGIFVMALLKPVVAATLVHSEAPASVAA